MTAKAHLLLALALAILAPACAKRLALPAPPQMQKSTGAGTTLSVRIEGARRPAGLIILSLFDESGDFPLRVATALRRVEEPLHEDNLELRLTDLPPGRYALAVLHDENADRALQTDWMGRPREGYAFSGERRIWRGLPNFDDAAFTLGTEEQRLVVELIYQ